MSNNAKQKPAHEIRLGTVKAAIWCNRTEKGSTFYNVTFSRSYRKENQWMRSDNFRRDDLPLLTTASEIAFEWVEALTAKERDADQAEHPEHEANL